MATGAKVESLSKPVTLPSYEGFKSTISKLSASNLADLCQRLRVQLIQQRLPIICATCRPNLVRAFNMELNLTQMLRGLCKSCKELFMAGPNMGISRKPVFPGKLIKSFDSSKSTLSAKIKKVILKISGSPKVSDTSRQGMNYDCKNPIVLNSTLSDSSSSNKIVHVTRSLSAPTAILGKRRYAKQFDASTKPPLTPPPTPARLGRKRRATTDLASEVLICFEPDAVLKRPSLIKSVVFTPSFRSIEFPPIQPPPRVLIDEILKDELLLTRHARYEEVEKTMRLCRPEVLRSLYDKSPMGKCNKNNNAII